jgi:hypothetical protein
MVTTQRHALATGTSFKRRKTMSDDCSKSEQKLGTGSDVPASDPANTGDRPMIFDCCGARTGDEMAGCPCGSMMRRHPVVTFTVLTLMGLAVIVIPTGAILGIIAFLRTF